MASTLINNLYPPFVDTFMPVFVEDGNADSEFPSTAIIQFSISLYNDTDSVKYVHVTLTNQQTNRTVLQDGVHGFGTNAIIIRDGVLLVPFSEELFNPNTGLYEIAIPNSYLKKDLVETSSGFQESKAKFQIGTFYQAQLRFDNTDEQITADQLLTHLIQNRSHFSEWSRVTLLRAIPRPILEFDNLDYETETTSTIRYVANEEGDYRWTREDKTNNGYEDVEYNRGLIPISAAVGWYQNGTAVADAAYLTYSGMHSIITSEYLSQYRVIIHTKNRPNDVLVDSGWIQVASSERNSIYYLADMTRAKENEEYIIHIDCISRNDYRWWDEREIRISVFNTVPFEAKWNFSTVKINSYNDVDDKVVTEEDGFVRCQVTSASDLPPGYLYIFRTSSLDNYKTSVVIQVTYQNGKISTIFEDKTVGSLIQYRYKAQYKIKANEQWSKVQAAPLSVYPDFYDMLFLRQDKQLAVRFDGNISSLKPVVNRTKIDTLGGKYPRFAENALMNYKQFSISGIISAEEDFNRQFINEKDEDIAPTFEAYDDHIGSIDLVRNDTILQSTENPILGGFHDTYPHDNWYLERTFRNKVTDWLNDGEPKLFRSMTEGNMIVMLTDVNLTPVGKTSRRLYNFTATMYEIGDGYDLDEIIKHGIYVLQDEEHQNRDTDSKWDEDYITVKKVGQYVNTYFTYDTNFFNMVGLNNAGQGLQLNDDTGSYNLATTSLTDLIRAEMKGINKIYKYIDSSIRLKDVRIQFTSKPYWLKTEGSTISKFDDVSDLDPNTIGLMLGYDFILKTDQNDINEFDMPIFVGPKGYYEVPSDISVKEIQMRPGNDFIVDFKIEYLTEYDTSGLVNRTQTVRKVIGQQNGVFQPYVWQGDLIRKKYAFREYTNDNEFTALKSEELMENWTGLSFDVTPYALAYIQEVGSTDWQERLVGQTGVYNLMTDYPIQDFYFAGRRMVQAPVDNRPYLDEWEYVLDQTVTNVPPDDEDDFEDYWYEIIYANPNSAYVQETDELVRVALEDGDKNPVFSYWQDLEYRDEELYGYILLKNIKDPKYNTIYKVVDENGQNPVYLIYYLDQGWYPVDFEDDSMKTAVAQVPISGMVNYRGTVVRYHYNV